MNTIQDLAKELGITTEAIRKKLRNNPEVLAQLAFEKQGTKKVYTDESYRMVRELFANQSTTTTAEVAIMKEAQHQLSNEVERLQSVCKQMQERAESAEREAAAAQELAAVYKKAAEEAGETIKQLMRQQEQMIQAVHAAQVLQMAAQKPTIMQRIKARLTGGDKPRTVEAQPETPEK